MRIGVLVLTLVTSACSGVGPFAPLPPGGTITVGPSNPVLGAIGASVQLQLIQSDVQAAQVVDVAWSSSNPDGDGYRLRRRSDRKRADHRGSHDRKYDPDYQPRSDRQQHREQHRNGVDHDHGELSS